MRQGSGGPSDMDTATSLDHTNNPSRLRLEPLLFESSDNRLQNRGIRHDIRESSKMLDDRIRQLRREIEELRDSIERHIETPRDLLIR